MKLIKGQKLIDIGCGFGRTFDYFFKHEVFVSGIDISSRMIEAAKKSYENEDLITELIVSSAEKLPFKDKEFDFVYSSHVIEHVEDVSYFIKEIERISYKGYIELPSLLEDNIVLSDNSLNDHKWIFQFNDINKILLIEKKKQLIEPFITHGILFSSLRKNFRSSLVLELMWEDKIQYKFSEFTIPVKKPYFITIIKKYLSYRIRNNKKVSLILILLLALFIINFFIL